MQLDIYIPSLSLAFEYHGKHHFEDVFYFGQYNQYKTRDEEKVAACKASGITLIVVPYWWDKTRQSLAATLYKVRPDIWTTEKNPQTYTSIPTSLPTTTGLPDSTITSPRSGNTI
jgi:hypothetical protein